MTLRAPPPGEVLCCLLALADVPRETSSVLVPAEIERAGRFREVRHREAWVGWRAALRVLLGRMLAVDPREIELVAGPYGKPVLGLDPPPFHFNLSHCEGFALFAFCVDGPVGVDIEPCNRGTDLLECAVAFCHPAELARASALPPAQRASFLLDCWVCKESLLKAVGTGLSQAPERVWLEWSGDTTCGAVCEPPLAGLGGLRATRLGPPVPADHAAAVAAPAGTRVIRVLDPAASAGLIVGGRHTDG